MKSIIIAFLLIAAAGCGETNDPNIKGETSDLFSLTVVNIEGCEYFQMGTARFYYIVTHKGNCCNPIHQQKQNQ